MSKTLNSQLVFTEGLATSFMSSTGFPIVPVGFQTQVDDVCSALADYATQIYAAADESVTVAPVAPTCAGDDATAAMALVQTYIDQVESEVIINLTAGSGTTNYGYPNDLREARGTLIASLYTLYKTIFDD